MRPGCRSRWRCRRSGTSRRPPSIRASERCRTRFAGLSSRVRIRATRAPGLRSMGCMTTSTRSRSRSPSTPPTSQRRRQVGARRPACTSSLARVGTATAATRPTSGVVVDLSRLASVHVTAGQAVVGAGARLGNIYDRPRSSRPRHSCRHVPERRHRRPRTRRRLRPRLARMGARVGQRPLASRSSPPTARS